MEDIKTNFSACKCNDCGKIEAYHRMGCSCMDVDSTLNDASLGMTYGFFLEVSGDFISMQEIKDHLDSGGKAYDPEGSEITADMFEL